MKLVNWEWSVIPSNCRLSTPTECQFTEILFYQLTKITLLRGGGASPKLFQQLLAVINLSEKGLL